MKEKSANPIINGFFLNKTLANLISPCEIPLLSKYLSAETRFLKIIINCCNVTTSKISPKLPSHSSKMMN